MDLLSSDAERSLVKVEAIDARLSSLDLQGGIDDLSRTLDKSEPHLCVL